MTSMLDERDQKLLDKISRHHGPHTTAVTVKATMVDVTVYSKGGCDPASGHCKPAQFEFDPKPSRSRAGMTRWLAESIVGADD